MAALRLEGYCSARKREFELVAFKETCEKVFVSPTELAQARHDLSSFILNRPRCDQKAFNLSALATRKGIFGPDELSVLRDLGIFLPSPWRPTEAAEERAPFPDSSLRWRSGQGVEKFIPSDYQLGRIIWEAIESDRRVGLYFMVCDLINGGHIDALTQAKSTGECDLLLLMLTTDLLTAGMKSSADDVRPKLPFHNRVYMASQIEAVDGVYAVPSVLSHADMVFEMASLAIAHERLGIRFDDCGDPRIRPLDLGIIQDLYPGEDWAFYVMAYLGLSPYRNPNLDACSGFYRPDIYPVELQTPYRHLWVNWAESQELDHFTLFTSDYDLKTAQLHIQQAKRFAWERGPRMVEISTSCPNTSSSLIFQNYPLRSNAEGENLATLGMLKEWGRDGFLDPRLFSGWKNPLLRLTRKQLC